MTTRYVILPLLVVCLLCGGTNRSAHADGGQVRLTQRHGDMQITVFTSPSPLRAGPVDVSVCIQDAATGTNLA